MVKISVISIARRDSEFDRLRLALADQTFRDFEFITSTKGTIPQAWNDAISRTEGELIVFTESDALPLNNHWLADIAAVAGDNVLLKGLEIKPTDLDLCNFVCSSSIIKEAKFDESFKNCEDVELFSRLRKKGLQVQFINSFPVIHAPSQNWRKTMTRALTLGMNFTKVIYLHGRQNIDDVNSRNIKGNHINPVSNRIRIIVEQFLILLGLVLGSVRYLPILVKHKKQSGTQ